MKEEKNNDFMDNPNLSIFNKVRKVPDNALKQINAGRLKGMSDVNPVWRILAMTDTFGVCGVGWKYEITKQWTETYGNEIKGFCNINLFIKVDGEWSDAILARVGLHSWLWKEMAHTFLTKYTRWL